MLNRLWRIWRQKKQLLDPRNRRPQSYFNASKICFPECELNKSANRPYLQPYDGLAALWDGYAGGFERNYSAFLMGLAKAKRTKLNSILDLAYGTGTLAIRLA